MTSFSIPEGIYQLDTMAFNGCYNLKTLNVPASVTTIGNSNIPTSVMFTCKAFDGAPVTEINFDDNTQIRYIRGCAFSNCEIEEIDLSNTINTDFLNIQPRAFRKALIKKSHFQNQ